MNLLYLVLICSFCLGLSSQDIFGVGCQDKEEELLQVKGNAGCLLKKDGLMLAVRPKKTGKWDIPSGKPEGIETANETAERETLEETGLKVKAVRLLDNFEGSFFIYECVLEDESDLVQLENLSVPIAALDEIVEVAFIDINLLTSENTRYPQLLPRIRELFKSLTEKH